MQEAGSDVDGPSITSVRMTLSCCVASETSVVLIYHISLIESYDHQLTVGLLSIIVQGVAQLSTWMDAFWMDFTGSPILYCKSALASQSAIVSPEGQALPDSRTIRLQKVTPFPF